MKKFKKLLSLVLVMIMVLAMAAPSFAATEVTGPFTITINNSTERHIYEAYQIFSGDLSVENDAYILSTIKWGTGVDLVKTIDDLDLAAALEAEYTDIDGGNAAEVAKKVDGFEDDSTEVDDFASIIGKYLVSADNEAVKTSTYNDADKNYTIEGLSAGYYLIKDKDESLEEAADSYTKFILQVVKDTSVDPKGTVPSVEKKVLENSYTNNDGYGLGYNDVADYNINDEVSFRLIGTLPENLADYDTYQYIFSDVLPTGLTYNHGTAKVYLVNGADIEVRTDITDYFIDAVTENSLVMSCDNVRAIENVTKDSKIVVEYTATLNEHAEIGSNGNINTVNLTYSNNPNGEGIGTTVADQVIVFTYQLDVTKEAETTSLKLPGAEFKLYRINEDAKEYVTVDDNGFVTGWVEDENEEDDVLPGTVLVSNANGSIIIKGLDDGEYFLKETKAPTGYNLLADEIKLDIEATTGNGQSWDQTNSPLTELKIKVKVGEKEETTNPGNVDTGIVNVTVKNSAGTLLPSTGGIGTTIFYAVGIILMAGAVFFVVRRKRA